MNKILLFNTLKSKKEEFKPINQKEVTLYSCGPTVYSYQHIGNLRTMLLADILKRTLIYNNYKVKHIINYTDVGHLTSDSDEGEDKVEKAAKKEGLSVKEITEKYIEMFESDLKKINIIFPEKFVKASEHVKEQIELIKKLEDNKLTYKTLDGIYFDTSKFKNYGKLANFKEIEKHAGIRIDLKDKKNISDFSLWKFSPVEQKRLQEWNSPWGKGFPGWHIECSAMSMKYLGETIDIHTGGQDLSQVHHNNEIAQSEGATKKKFVNYWIHGGFVLNKDGDKASKSTGGFYTISDLEKLNFNPLIYRYLCLLSHYKKPLIFNMEKLEYAKNSLNRIKRKITDLSDNSSKDKTDLYEKEFQKAINDDLNTPKAIQILIKMIDDKEFNTKLKKLLIKKFDTILGLDLLKEERESNIPKEIKELLKERDSLRNEKKWKDADKVRDKIKTLGYLIEDTSEGQAVKKID